MRKPFYVLMLLAATSLTATANGAVGLADRRTVDTVRAGDGDSESKHGYSGTDAISGHALGMSYRETDGVILYTLSSYFDSEVTVAVTALRLPGVERSFSLVVEDSVIAPKVVVPAAEGDSLPALIETLVPHLLTEGKSEITIQLRAVDGRSPAINLVQVIQDHFQQ